MFWLIGYSPSWWSRLADNGKCLLHVTNQEARRLRWKGWAVLQPSHPTLRVPVPPDRSHLLKAPQPLPAA